MPSAIQSALEHISRLIAAKWTGEVVIKFVLNDGGIRDAKLEAVERVNLCKKNA